MTREERETLEQRICNFYYDSAKKSVKATGNYFEKQAVPQSTRYYVLKKSIYNMEPPRICHEVVVHSQYPRRT